MENLSVHFWLFPTVKKDLRSWKYDNDADVWNVATNALKVIPLEEFQKTMKVKI